MESFIRSKYETRRWAQDIPLPNDPSVLDGETSSDPAQAAAPAPAQIPTQATTSTSFNRATANATPPVNRQPQPHQLLSTAIVDQRRQVPALTPPIGTSTPVAPAAPAPAAPDNDIFSLDFNAPAPSASPSQQPPKNVKQDILSLFSTPAAAPAAATNHNNNAFGNFQSGDWGAPAQQQQQPPTSMMGSTGWGASSGWSAPAPAAAAPAQSNIWGAPAPQQPDLFGANDIWGANPAAPAAGGGNIWGTGGATQQQPQKKQDDAFGDIWGGFK